MSGGLIRGVVGRVKWSYYVAAGIEGYTVKRDAVTNHWTLRANVALADKYKMAQKPLVFEALHDKGAWRWPITDFNLAEGVMIAQLGPLEVS